MYPVLGESDEAFTSLDWRDLNRLRAIPGVEAAAPVQAGRWGSYEYKGDVYRNEIVGIDENYFIVHGGENEVEEGRLLVHSDTAAALLGYNVATPEGEPRYHIGDRIKINVFVDDEQMAFTVRVIGTLKQTGGVTGSGVDDYIIIPLRYFEQIFNTQGKYLAIDLKAETIDDVERIKQSLEEDFEKLGYQSLDMIMDEINQIIGTINAVLGGIAGISLMVAGVTIVNTMTVSIMERTKEIGTLKAIGAKNTDVLLLFISESAVTGVIGGSLGAALGFLLSIIIGRLIGLPPSPSMRLGFTVTGFAVITCVLSGIYPAWRASNLHPVER
ncbi:MAG: ABC transporter permease [Candidatus Bathyarchaeota archaeon]|nr:ABC transporter permease [Candidatus Bathyarchaeota archaeon]